jgi:hypothetical protein
MIRRKFSSKFKNLTDVQKFFETSIEKFDFRF